MATSKDELAPRGPQNDCEREAPNERQSEHSSSHGSYSASNDPQFADTNDTIHQLEKQDLQKNFEVDVDGELEDSRLQRKRPYPELSYSPNQSEILNYKRVQTTYPQMKVDPDEPECGSSTLWQFLLELLINGRHPDLIQWTNQDGEFMLLQAEEVSRLWGARKNNNSRMNYDKLSRSLRYYYQKNIIQKVHGQKFVYRFVCLSDAGRQSCRKAMALQQDPHRVYSAFETEEDEQLRRSNGPSSSEKVMKRWLSSAMQKSPLTLANENYSKAFLSEGETASMMIKQSCCGCYCHSGQHTTAPEYINHRQPNAVSPDTTAINDITVEKKEVPISAENCTEKKAKVSPLLTHPTDLQFPNYTTQQDIVHHSRHNMNMHKLALEMSMQQMAPSFASSHQTAYSNKDHDNKEDSPNFQVTSPSQTPSAKNTSTNNMPKSITEPLKDYSLPRTSTEAIPSGGYSPNPFVPDASGCVWMPVPVSMLSSWWQVFAEAKKNS